MLPNPLALADDLWKMDFVLLPGAPEGELLTLRSQDDLYIRIRRDGEALTVLLDARWSVNTSHFGRQPNFTFRLDAPKGGRHFQLSWTDAALSLFADGALIDEDWLLGNLSRLPYDVVRLEGLDVSLLSGSNDPAAKDSPLPCPAQFYKPPYHNANAGDCMPFVSGGRYRLFHLFDRRHHQSKQQLGGHQWAQISSDNLKDWTLHPMAIGIDEQWEGSICTGSMIEYEGNIYAFYAIRMSDGSPAKLSWAISWDGVHFEKSRKYFTLSHPYEPTSARDPKVFKDSDGLYHMLVTTSILDGRSRSGCLAHLTSRNLIDWDQHEPFLVPGFPGQPECSDYFEWNGYYYLSFANNLTARYRISKDPFGPWTRPMDEIVVSPNLAVPKLASFNGRRLVSGWLSDGGWGGWAITFELFQRTDGSLGVKYIEEMMPDLHLPALHPVCADASIGYAEKALACSENPFRIKGTLTLDRPDAVGEMVLRFGDDEYRICFDPLEKTVSFFEPKMQPLDENGHNRLINVNGMDKPFDMDLIVYNHILLLLLPDGRLLLPSKLNHSGTCSIFLACRDGKASFAPVH